MTKEQLLERLADIEWDDFEVKEAREKLPENVWETVSAFSNVSGGWVVFGVRQRGKQFDVVGVENGEKMESDFLNTMRNGQKFNFKLYPKAQKYDVDGKLVLAFFVPSSPFKPIYFGSPVNTFVRSGSADRRANEMEIAAMMRDQAFGSKSEEVIKGTSIDDLNPSSFETYRNYLRGFNPQLSFNAYDDSHFCERVGITVNGELTYGGLLMLGKADVVRRYVRNFWIDYLEIPGKSYSDAPVRYTYRMPELDNIWECYNVILQRLRIYADNPYAPRPDGFAPDDESRLYALREGLVNLCSHADYFSPAHPTIRVFSDRIMFQNPGRFVIDPNDQNQRLQSLPRNPTIIRMFRHAKLSENGGYGFDKMLSWKTLTGQNVTFRTDLLLAEVTYYRQDVNALGQWATPVTTPVAGETTPVTTPVVGETTPVTTPVAGETTPVTTDLMILNLISVTPKIRKTEIAELCGLSLEGVRYQIRKLRRAGRLNWVGNSRTGHWVIEDDSKADVSGNTTVNVK